MASSLARLGAALPRARPGAAARAMPPGRWDAAALGASRRAALNGKSELAYMPISLLLFVARGAGDWVDRRAVLAHESSFGDSDGPIRFRLLALLLSMGT